MDTWILWICGCSVAFWLGKAVGTHIGTLNVLKVLANDPNTIQDVITKLKIVEQAETSEDLDFPIDAIPLELEEVNGQIFAYNKLTGEFLSQAHDIEQAARIARQRFPGKTFWHPELKKDSQTA